MFILADPSIGFICMHTRHRQHSLVYIVNKAAFTQLCRRLIFQNSLKTFSTFNSNFSTWTKETSWTIELQGLENHQDHRITGTREPIGPQNYRDYRTKRTIELQDYRTNRTIELQGLENQQDHRITGTREQLGSQNYRDQRTIRIIELQ